MSDEQVTIEVDGRELTARKGQMLMEVTDAADVYIPRFCYHKKLSVVANCRMCLVEVEKAPKPMPACATPVADGMKVHTRSEKTVDAQKGTMEFLLINHPLDCPICDQGGECELQDLAMGFGSDVSRFYEGKRAVEDENLGPLIATDMTRCIHCTRCVRFGEEVAGLRELGATDRSEHMRIGTYVGRAMASEVAGNIIDLCPVGALTDKPYRFTARAWELTQHPGVSPHDAVGANMGLHVRRGDLMRVVPLENEAVNETWIADRDRFGFRGMYAPDRVTSPLIRRDGELRRTDWETALTRAAEILRDGDPAGLGMLAAPSATLEELYLLRRLADGLGCPNLDHRLRQSDFSDQDRAPLFPWLGQSLGDLEHLDAGLVVGSDLRGEVPLVHLRLRKAALRGGRLSAINPCDFDVRFGLDRQRVSADLVGELAAVAAAASRSGRKGKGKSGTVPADIADLVQAAQPGDDHREIAAALEDGARGTVLLGQIAGDHPDLAALRALAAFIAEATGASLGYLPEAGNSAGAWLAGVVPHRGPGGAAAERAGRTAAEMAQQGMSRYLLLGLEPELDCDRPGAALASVRAASAVVTVSPYLSETAAAYSDVVLPAGSFAETAGTYVNAEGRWQSARGAARPVGESRPGWKILRVLGNVLELPGFEHTSADEVRDELAECLGGAGPDNAFRHADTPIAVSDAPRLRRIGSVAPYACDALVRRSEPLQETPQAEQARKAHMNPADAETWAPGEPDTIVVRQGEGRARLALVLDERVARGCIRIASGIAETAELGARFGAIEVEPAE